MLTIAGVVLGATIGFVYWQQIGCNSGTCAITSSPVNSTIYGAVMGALILNIFRKEDNRKETKNENPEKVL